MNINSKTQISEIMEKYGLTFHKGLGQNFLYDEQYLDEIVASANITKEDTVVEIGPGLGVLTTRMASLAKKVIAIEIDQNIIPALSEITSEFDNVEIVNKDVMKTNIEELVSGEENIKVVANLPYYITTPIIMKLLSDNLNLKCIVIMIQKEVAERLSAKEATKDYGAITVSVNYYADPLYMFTVPKGAFVPQPKVDSAVVKLNFPKKEPVTVSDEKLFFNVVKGAFAQRRKTLLNSLSSTLNQFSKEQIKTVITECGFEENIRGEVLSLNDFCLLTEKFKNF